MGTKRGLREKDLLFSKGGIIVKSLGWSMLLGGRCKKKLRIGKGGGHLFNKKESKLKDRGRGGNQIR